MSRFGDAEPDQLAGRRAACAEEPCSRRRRSRPDPATVAVSRPASTAPGSAEEEEQHLGVEGVGAGAAERGAEVVADESAAGER